jgi:uncharacterized protein (DUF488 family)
VARLYTIGHSNRTVAELVAALRAYDVDTLVDIRHFTRSRANPQFNEAPLRRALAKHGIAYEHVPALGGRRSKSKLVDPARNAGWQHSAFKNYADYAEGPEFQAALAALVKRAQRSTCAIMCAEVLWWRCHRRIISDVLVSIGAEVVHIRDARTAEPHRLAPPARVVRGRLTYAGTP